MEELTPWSTARVQDALGIHDGDVLEISGRRYRVDATKITDPMRGAVEASLTQIFEDTESI